MPKRVDYAGRFEFLREAAFTIVLEQGPARLSRRSVAAALGSSVNTVVRLVAPDVPLLALAAREVEQRRRYGRLGVPRDLDGLSKALHQLRKLLPDTETRVAEELVWLRLVLETHRPDLPAHPEGSLQERFRVAEGLDDDISWGERRPDEVDPGDRSPAATADRPDRLWLDPFLQTREEAVRVLVDSALAELGMTDDQGRHRRRDEGGDDQWPTQEDNRAESTAREQAESTLRVLLSGITLEVCLARMTPEQGVAVLVRELGRLAPG